MNPCPAIVSKSIDSVYTLTKDHKCVLEANKKLRLVWIEKTKSLCSKNNFMSANAVALPLLLKASREHPGVKLPAPSALVMAGNRFRAQTRPKHPQTHFFDLDF